MKRSHVIALDAHCKFTEIGVLTPAGRMSKRGRCATAIPELLEQIKAVGLLPKS
jgi:hypothetical protein